MIEDSVTIIVLGNKYNRAIYDAKKMAAIFQPSLIIEDDEKAANVKDESSLTPETDSTAANKVDFFTVKDTSKKKAPPVKKVMPLKKRKR